MFTLGIFFFTRNVSQTLKLTRTMSLLEQLKSKKSKLKSTVTNITYADGTQEKIVLSKDGCDVVSDSNQTNKLKQTDTRRLPKTYGFVVDTKPDQIPAIILDDFLYLGSQDSITLENVQKYQLTDILSVGIPAPDSDIVYGDSSVRNHFIECLDMPNTSLDVIIKQTNEIIERVHAQNGRILVHCNAGVSRSASVCIAYLMFHRKMDFTAAYSHVKSKRECIRPNDGFLKQLKQMDRLCIG